MIRRLTEADALAYGELRLFALKRDAFAFSSSWEEEAERDWVAFFQGQAPEDFILGAFDVEALVGITGFWREKKRKLAHRGGVWGVFVRPEQRGNGLAKALMAQLLVEVQGLPGLRQLHLGVAAENAPARRVYEAHGFVAYGTEPQALFVDGGYHDEVLMCRMLPEDE